MWRKCLCALAVLLTIAAFRSLAAGLQGTVLEVTTDTITIRGERSTETLKLSAELLTNTLLPPNPILTYAKFTDLKRGCQVVAFYDTIDGEPICRCVRIYPSQLEKEDGKENKRQK